MLAEVAEEAGFPPGVINVVTHAPGAAGPIADEFFDRPEVRIINLIGGVKTARMLAERAGRLLKRTVMELGGFNPMIILDDVDMDYAGRSTPPRRLKLSSRQADDRLLRLRFAIIIAPGNL